MSLLSDDGFLPEPTERDAMDAECARIMEESDYEREIAELRAEVARLRRTAQIVLDIIHGVEQRCMAADGPVTPTCDEITDDELRAIYRACCSATQVPT